MAMRMDVMSRTELIVLSLISVGILVACLIIGGTGPQASIKTMHSAANCSHARNSCPPPFDAERCTGVAVGDGAPYTLVSPTLNVLDGYWALAGFPVRGANTSSAQLALLNARGGLTLSLLLEGRLPGASAWTTVASETRRYAVYCHANSCTCDGWWLFTVGFLKYEQLRASVQLVNVTSTLADGLFVDVRFREQTGNDAYNDLRLGFRLSWLSVGVVVFAVYLFVMRNHGWHEFTFEQKGALVLLLLLTGYNDPFFPFKFLVDSVAFPVLGAIFEELFVFAAVLFWIFFYDRYRRAEGAAWNPWHWTELLKYALVASYFVLAISLYTWVRSLEQSNPIPGEQLPTGILVLFYLAALAFAGIFLYVVVLILIVAGPIQGRQRTFRRFMYVSVPTVVVLVSVMLGVFTNSLGPYGRTLAEFMYFFGLWNLYVWLLVYGAWPAKGGFSHSNAYADDLDLDVVVDDAEQKPTEATSLLAAAAPMPTSSLEEFLDAQPPAATAIAASSSSDAARPRATYVTNAPAAAVSSEQPFGAASRTDLGDDEGL